MKCRFLWMVLIHIFVVCANPAFGAGIGSQDLSGRMDEEPGAMLVVEEEIFVAFQSPGRVAVYDLEWREKRNALLPEDFVPHEMIHVDGGLWILEEDQNLILKLDPMSLEILAEIGGFPVGLSALHEREGRVFALNLDGYVYQVEEDLAIEGWITGMSRVEAALFDGFVTYLAGRVASGCSGVLVKTLEDEVHDVWKLSDDPDAPANTSFVERIKLMSNGFFYVVYRDAGIVKYDLEGNIYNQIYQETGGGRVFEDLIYLEDQEKFYLSDLKGGVFALTWPEDEIILVADPVEEMEEEEPSDDWWDLDDWNDFDQWLEWVDENLDDEEDEDESDYEKRLEVRTWKGTTTARVGQDRLFGFYHEEDLSIRIRLYSRETEVLKLKVPMADLMKARDAGYASMQIHLNDRPHAFDMAGWPLAMRNPEIFEEQYLEICIDPDGWAVDGCYVERVDETTRVVRRNPYE